MEASGELDNIRISAAFSSLLRAPEAVSMDSLPALLALGLLVGFGQWEGGGRRERSGYFFPRLPPFRAVVG